MTIQTDQTTAALDRRKEGTRRTDDLCWPEAKLLGEAIRERIEDES